MQHLGRPLGSSFLTDQVGVPSKLIERGFRLWSIDCAIRGCRGPEYDTNGACMNEESYPKRLSIWFIAGLILIPLLTSLLFALSCDLSGDDDFPLVFLVLYSAPFAVQGLLTQLILRSVRVAKFPRALKAYAFVTATLALLLLAWVFAATLELAVCCWGREMEDYQCESYYGQGLGLVAGAVPIFSGIFCSLHLVVLFLIWFLPPSADPPPPDRW